MLYGGEKKEQLFRSYNREMEDDKELKGNTRRTYYEFKTVKKEWALEISKEVEDKEAAVKADIKSQKKAEFQIGSYAVIEKNIYKGEVEGGEGIKENIILRRQIHEACIK